VFSLRYGLNFDGLRASEDLQNLDPTERCSGCHFSFLLGISRVRLPFSVLLNLTAVVSFCQSRQSNSGVIL
jgi:hypothetical protein